MIITLTLSFLVALNFLLLIFSCNKDSKRVLDKNPKIIKSPKVVKTSVATKEIANRTQLAPTGS